MNAGQGSKANMYRALRTTVQENPDALTASQAFAAAYTEFAIIIGKIDVALSLQGISSKPTTTAKTVKRTSVVVDLRKICSALRIFGTTSNNVFAKDAGTVTKSFLAESAQDTFIGRAQLILKAAVQYAGALEALGISPEMLDGATSKLNAYMGMVGSPKYAISERRRGTGLIAEYLLAADALLVDRMDPAVELMGPALKPFVTEYFFSREVQKPAYRTRALQFSIADAVTGDALKSVRARIMPGNLIKVTTAKGGFYVSSMAEGTYEMTLELPGYVNKVVRFNVIQGERTLLAEKLVPVGRAEGV